MDTLDAKHTSANTQNIEIQASTLEAPVDAATVQIPTSRLQRIRHTWLSATLSILPVYIAVHIGFF